ncbi:hypothetical protein [Mycobacteroides chelonae]|uniref:hypothetical protein n=1 Tax=Mycobacteroides chelonae TaxID=1774 RepID=UPI001F256298|nr:hypothetical protein [Mycobacteroides chelonae]
MSTTAVALPLDIPIQSTGNAPSVAMSWGMGLDSTALLLRWILEPHTRDFELDDLVLCTSMTGNEFFSTYRDVTNHVLPVLREHNVRFVQIARSQRKTTKAGGGVVVLDDSRQPQQLHIQGQYTLADEMLAAGTIPQLGGIRACSIHSKGECLDPVIADITAGNPFRHVIGYESGEINRANKDRLYDTDLRTGWYPLVEWGWDRQRCQDYVQEVLGCTWHKSACTFCPFAMTTAAGRAALLQRYREEPDAGAQAMFLEHVARSLNPTQTLIAGSSVADLITDAGLQQVLEHFQARQATSAYSVYEVRRLVRPAKKPGGRGIVARSVKVLATGTRTSAEAFLTAMPGHRHTGPDGIVRHHVRQRDTDGVDHLYVAAPAGVEAKQRSSFEHWWSHATSQTVF